MHPIKLYNGFKSTIIWALGLITGGQLKAAKAATADNSTKFGDQTPTEVKTDAANQAITGLRNNVATDWDDLAKVKNQVDSKHNELVSKYNDLNARTQTIQNKKFRGSHVLDHATVGGLTFANGGGVYNFHHGESSPEYPADQTADNDGNLLKEGNYLITYNGGTISFDSNDIIEVVVDEDGTVMSARVAEVFDDEIDWAKMQQEILDQLVGN